MRVSACSLYARPVSLTPRALRKYCMRRSKRSIMAPTCTKGVLLSSHASSARFFSRAPFGAPAFLTPAAGVGPRRQWSAAVSGFVGSSCQESHSGALLALSPSCQVDCVLAAVFLLFVLTHTPCQRGHFSLAYSLCTLFANLNHI